MAKETDKPKEEKFNFEKYLAGDVAYKYVNSPNFENEGSRERGLTRIALDTAAADLSPEAKKLIEYEIKVGMYKPDTPEGMSQGATIFAQMSQDNIDSKKIKELLPFVMKYYGKLSDPNKKKLEFVYNSAGDETIGKVREDFLYAQEKIIQFKKDTRLSEKDKKEKSAEFQKTIDKYALVLQLYELAHSQAAYAIEGKVTGTYTNKALEAMLESVELPKPDPKEGKH